MPDDFALVTGRDKPVDKDDLLREARKRMAEYELQHAIPLPD